MSRFKLVAQLYKHIDGLSVNLIDRIRLRMPRRQKNILPATRSYVYNIQP